MLTNSIFKNIYCLHALIHSLSRVSSSLSQLRCRTPLPFRLSSSTHDVVLAASRTSTPSLPLTRPFSFSRIILALSLLHLNTFASLPLTTSLAPTHGHCRSWWSLSAALTSVQKDLSMLVSTLRYVFLLLFFL